MYPSSRRTLQEGSRFSHRAIFRAALLCASILLVVALVASVTSLAGTPEEEHQGAMNGARQASASPALLATMTVNSTDDVANGTDGKCTLREAITAANTDTASGAVAGECVAGSGDDAIFFSVMGTINLQSALPDITTAMAANGPPLLLAAADQQHAER